MTDEKPTDGGLRQRLVQQAVAMSGMPREEFDEKASLDTLGLDSSDAVILAMQIEEILDEEVEVGIFLRVETIGDAIDEILRSRTKT